MEDKPNQEQQELEQARKLPLDERVSHKSWKARSDLYEEMKQKLDKVVSEEDSVLSEYGSLFPKAVQDGNAAAMEKALEALQTYLNKASISQINTYSQKVTSNIVAKSLNQRPKTVQIAHEVFLLFVEAEQGEAVVDSLVGGFTHKIPKAVLAAEDILLQCLKEFGAKTLTLPPIFKGLPTLFDSKDNKARDKAKEIVVELTRWVGAQFIRTSLITHMREVQQKEVENIITNIPNERPTPSRFTRSQQKRKQQQEQQELEQENIQDNKQKVQGDSSYMNDQDVDVYEMFEAKSILPLLKKDFWEGLESKKWNERKEALQQLKAICQANPKLQNDNYSNLLTEIKKIILRDSNVVCVAEAISSMGALAQGLRKDFTPSAKIFTPIIIERLKEKNSNVCNQCLETLNIFHKYCWQINDVLEDITTALNHQNPKLKEYILGWLTENIKNETKQSYNKCVGTLVPQVCKCVSDAQPSIREAAINSMVQLAIKSGGMNPLDKYLKDVDPTRLKKIQELVMESFGLPKPGGGGGGAAGRQAQTNNGSVKVNLTDSKSNNAQSLMSPQYSKISPSRSNKVNINNSKSGSQTFEPVGKGSSTNISRNLNKSTKQMSRNLNASGKPGTKKQPGDGQKTQGIDQSFDEDQVSAGVMTKEAAAEKLPELMGEDVFTGLQSSVWKDRLTAVETILDEKLRLQQLNINQNGALIIQLISHFPGWSEKIGQVLNKQFAIVNFVSKETSNISKTDAYCAIIGLIEKIFDKGNKDMVYDTLMNFGEIHGPFYVIQVVHKKAEKHKNPKVYAEALQWISNTVEQFGARACGNIKELVEYIKKGLNHTNPAIKTSALSLAGSLHKFVGPQLKDLIGTDIKAALQQSLDEEFQKNPQSKIEPTRQLRSAKKTEKVKQADADDVNMDDANKITDEAPLATARSTESDDLIPRTDINNQITSSLLTDLNGPNWKDRKTALEEIDTILQQAGYRVQSNVDGELIALLKARFNDTNKNLISHCLITCGKLARSMGSGFESSGRALLFPGFKAIYDQKVQIREACVQFINECSKVMKKELVLRELLVVFDNPKCQSQSRAQILQWMVGSFLENVKDQDADQWAPYLMGFIGIGYQDKNSEVRKATDQLTKNMLNTLGAKKIQRIVQSSDHKYQQSCREAFQKAQQPEQATTDTKNLPFEDSNVSSKSSQLNFSQSTSQNLSSSQFRSRLMRNSTDNSNSAVLNKNASGTFGSGFTSGTPKRPSLNKKMNNLSLKDHNNNSSSLKSPSTLEKSTTFRSNSSRQGHYAQMDVDEERLIVKSSRKDDRERRHMRLKRTSLVEIRSEDHDQLQNDLAQVVSQATLQSMFNKDFKQHCQIAEQFSQATTQGDYNEELISNLDVLLRWVAIRINDEKLQSMIKLLNLARDLILLCQNISYNLSDYEAQVFLPQIIEKSGHNQDKIRSSFRDILRLFAEVYSPRSLILYLQDGFESKNNRSKAEALGEVGCVIQRKGINVLQGQKQTKVIQQIAKQVLSRDTSVRQASLTALSEIYIRVGPNQIWNLIGRISDQQKSLIEERFKYTRQDMLKKGKEFPGQGQAQGLGVANSQDNFNLQKFRSANSKSSEVDISINDSQQLSNGLLHQQNGSQNFQNQENIFNQFGRQVVGTEKAEMQGDPMEVDQKLSSNQTPQKFQESQQSQNIPTFNNYGDAAFKQPTVQIQYSNGVSNDPYKQNQQQPINTSKTQISNQQQYPLGTQIDNIRQNQTQLEQQNSYAIELQKQQELFLKQQEDFRQQQEQQQLKLQQQQQQLLQQQQQYEKQQYLLQQQQQQQQQQPQQLQQQQTPQQLQANTQINQQEALKNSNFNDQYQQTLNKQESNASNGEANQKNVQFPFRQSNLGSTINAQKVGDQRTAKDFEDSISKAMVMIHSQKLDDIINGMKIICFELIDLENSIQNQRMMQIISESADEIVQQVSQVLVQVFDLAFIYSSDKNQSARGCKYALNTLMQIFQVQHLSSKCSFGTLRNTIHVILFQLLRDEPIMQLTDGQQLLRAMNILILKIIENCDKTLIYGVFMDLLKEQPDDVIQQGPKNQNKYQELCTKCLIKLTKSLQQLCQENKINVSQLLLYIHQYLSYLGNDEIKRLGQQDFKPLRMVKTIVHELCKIKEQDILNETGSIPNEQPTPIIFSFIDLYLQSMFNIDPKGGNITIEKFYEVVAV